MKKSQLSARVMERTVQYTVGQALNAYSYCPINDEIRTDDNQSDLGIFCSYD